MDFPHVPPQMAFTGKAIPFHPNVSATTWCHGVFECVQSRRMVPISVHPRVLVWA